MRSSCIRFYLALASGENLIYTINDYAPFTRIAPLSQWAVA